jgi:hypothetical protein
LASIGYENGSKIVDVCQGRAGDEKVAERRATDAKSPAQSSVPAEPSRRPIS